MSSQVTDTIVRNSIVVDAPAELAFEVFTAGIGSWWPADHHIIEAPLAEMVFEPRVGGDVFDRGTDGSECRWARVLAYEPPKRFVITWNITPAWKLETDLDKVSEIEVRFIPESPSRTRVELEHRNLERHGDGWENIRDAVRSEGGWGLTLSRFAERARAQA